MRRRILLLRFFLVAFAIFNIASCWVNYDNPADPNAIDVWSNKDPEDNAPIPGSGITYFAFRTNELALFSKKTDGDKHCYYSCINFNPENHHCASSVLQWGELPSEVTRGHDFIRKMDMGMLIPFEQDSVKYYYDTAIYGFPFTYIIHNTLSGLKITVLAHRAGVGYRGTYPLKIYDEKDLCKNYRPKYGEFKGADVMSISVYYNYKDQQYITYPYVFFKKESDICVYRFNSYIFSEDKKSGPDKVYTINNYPTEGYAPKFFAVDPLYGTFVSIFWNGQRESPPEVHFFAFNENEPNNIQRIDKFTLTGFDQDVLADIYSGNYDDDSQPQFRSYGRQIFVSFKRKGASEEFACLWKDETEFTPIPRHIDNFNKLWHVRKDYIQIWKPVKPFDETIEFNENVTSATLAPEIASTSSMLIPETVSISTMPEFDGNSTSMKPDSTASPSHDSQKGDYDNEGEEAGADADNIGETSFGAQCLQSAMFWLFVLFVLLDIVAVVALIIVIIFERRGAKKLKDAILKKSKSAQKKNQSKVAAVSAAPSTTAKPEPKKGAKKKEKKSAQEESSVTKSACQPSSVASKITTTADPSKYYTVDTSLRHGAKK